MVAEAWHEMGLKSAVRQWDEGAPSLAWWDGISPSAPAWKRLGAQGLPTQHRDGNGLARGASLGGEQQHWKGDKEISLTV